VAVLFDRPGHPEQWATHEMVVAVPPLVRRLTLRAGPTALAGL
jgi:hypothetical protein